MHLLAAQPGAILDGSVAVDLGQSPADIVVLTAADSEIAGLSAARARVAGRLRDSFPSLRLANLLRLQHNLSVDLYIEKVIAHARLVIVRLLGGRGYWPYGVDQIVAACRDGAIPLAFLPGDDQPDPELFELSSLPPEAAHRLWQYLVHGGGANAEQFLCAAASITGFDAPWRPPAPILRAGVYVPGTSTAAFHDATATWIAGQSCAAVVFYRALVQADDTRAIDALIEGLRGVGLNPLAIFVASLKDPVAAASAREILAEAKPDVIVNLTGFAIGAADAAPDADPLALPDCPVLQAVLSTGDAATWRAGTRGLNPRDLAMSVALPEIDGRILSRAIAFKGVVARDRACESDIIGNLPEPDRIAFVAELAKRWAKLRRTPAAERRIAIVLANYPNRDGRIGNGVGLDTPQSVVETLSALGHAGYRIEHAPADGSALMRRLLAGPTNDSRRMNGPAEERLSLIDYSAFFTALPAALRDKVSARWGAAEDDPFFRASALDCGAFHLPLVRYGNVVIGVQPARGYNIDPRASYHDPALPPPHNYFAFYAWLAQSFRADAVIHFGKHGNLEWLPGKSLALSAECFPEAALGPCPHLYPFIVNDPGEGTQAKRRASAVVIDHLTPPLTRAGSYGPLAALERLIDEYYEASGSDPRRLGPLGEEIRALAQTHGLDRDCGIAPDAPTATALARLDGWLCELKDMQIRDGLHVFGRSPEGVARRDLLVAIARSPRGSSAGRDASLLRALADDLDLGFDPLGAEMGERWTGPRPAALGLARGWRTYGDTIDRLEALASALVGGERAPDRDWARTRAVLDWISDTLAPAIDACGAAERAGLIAGLAGRRVVPGPSGAPTRGRPEVAPTGRNFYSIDTRAVPTAAAWTLGWKSASLLVERHVQEHGAFPQALALSAWGTSNMRTGGDDIAQALALIGARPTWDQGSRRVTGFEVLPLSILDRPRIDVTLRVSGFFRDAFPGLIDLFDSAVRAIAALDEPAEQNPLAMRVRAESEALVASGMSRNEAARRAGARVFGSKPGAYGAGLQALIDERGWETAADLARAYVAWGGYVYGAGSDGDPAHGLFETRLRHVEAVVHNQDNREHDLLDSDDYYQFEGGLAAAVRHLKGAAPSVYHNDHSQPSHPRIRTLEEEVARVVRARVVNPKWIAGVMRHGYKGAFEMAATVDYLFAFAATTNAVRDSHFEAVFDAYVGDETVRGFIMQSNPPALAEMSERLIEAQTRGLWHPRANSARTTLEDCVRRGRDARERAYAFTAVEEATK